MLNSIFLQLFQFVENYASLQLTFNLSYIPVDNSDLWFRYTLLGSFYSTLKNQGFGFFLV